MIQQYEWTTPWRRERRRKREEDVLGQDWLVAGSSCVDVVFVLVEEIGEESGAWSVKVKSSQLDYARRGTRQDKTGQDCAMDADCEGKWPVGEWDKN